MLLYLMNIPKFLKEWYEPTAINHGIIRILKHGDVFYLEVSIVSACCLYEIKGSLHSARLPNVTVSVLCFRSTCFHSA
jgi:hypothetical protein